MAGGESNVISEIQKDYVYRLAREGKRFDGRALDEYRPVSIQTNLIEQAEGSARVKLGDTDVIVGVKLMPGTPYPDSPNSGTLASAAELIPMASPTFEAGPPRQESIELARVVDRGIRETHTLDMEKLCIEPGEKIWVCFLDMHVVDYDGNLFDACSLGAIAALATGVVPNSKHDLGDDVPLPVTNHPIMTTAMKIGGTTVFDPGLIEDEVGGPRLSVSTDMDGNVRAMQKGLVGAFSRDEVLDVIRKSAEKGQELRDLFYKETGVKRLK